MTVFFPTQARESMVQSQLQPAGITSDRIIDAYRQVAREDFLPEHLHAVSYADETVLLGDGQFLIEPMLHGLMIAALDPQQTDRVLNIGDTTGYSAAVISRLTAHVTDVFQDAGHEFDVIFINGAISFIPQELTSLLNEGGRLVCIYMPEAKKVGKIMLVTKEANGVLARRILGDARAPYVTGLEPTTKFDF